MARKIVTFLSTFRDNQQECEYACPDGTTVTGAQTNDAPVKYLLNRYRPVKEIICIVTDEAQGRALEHFERTAKEVHGGVQIRPVRFGKEDDFESGPLAEIMGGMKSGDEILLETTGGLRNAVMHLLLLSRVLSYSGIHTLEAVYSNFSTKTVEDISRITDMFELVGGMEQLTSFGSVKKLREYYGDEPEDAAIAELLASMEALNEAITLCRTALIDGCMERFGKALNAAGRCADPLMRQLIPAFKNKFGRKMSATGLIKWCMKSGMLQQALTVYVERIPAYMEKHGVIALREGQRRCGYLAHEDPAAAQLMRGFLSLSGMGGASADDDPSARYVKTIETLETLNPRNSYKLRFSINHTKKLLRDYLYIKELRNMTNHASHEGTGNRAALLSYLEGFGYRPLENADSAYIMEVLTVALDRLVNEKHEEA